ncbi:MAG: DUF3473 domain-containing protein [Planctomycetes bacterium]|nr:DUF3473 domain-containing protein [Planctomycetota bacterium]
MARLRNKVEPTNGAECRDLDREGNPVGACSGSTPGLPVGAITIDVEEWFHARNLHITPVRWSELPSRVERSIVELLELLARHEVQATFFVLGWVAHRHAAMVRRIHNAGHEIASHGYWHHPVDRLTPAQFRGDVRASKAVLEDLVGEPVHGYRAPGYSISRSTLWALDELADAGFAYDSSIYPARAPHGRYGIRDAPRVPYQIRPGLWEFPLPTFSVLGYRVPAATGAYLRLWPFAVTRFALRQNRKRCVPVIVNVHPWELDPQQPRWPAHWWERALHYTSLGATAGRLERMLATQRFVPVRSLRAAMLTAAPDGAGTAVELLPAPCAVPAVEQVRGC